MLQVFRVHWATSLFYLHQMNSWLPSSYCTFGIINIWFCWQLRVFNGITQVQAYCGEAEEAIVSTATWALKCPCRRTCSGAVTKQPLFSTPLPTRDISILTPGLSLVLTLLGFHSAVSPSQNQDSSCSQTLAVWSFLYLIFREAWHHEEQQLNRDF